MTAPPYMPWYPRDYLGDTTHLTRDEDGGYRLLLDACWLRGGKLPDDDHLLARITKCATPEEWQKLRVALAPFFKISHGLWRQKRLQKEFSAASKLREKQSEGGKKGAATRWPNRAKPENGLPNGSAMGDPMGKPMGDPMAYQISEPEPVSSPPIVPPSRTRGGRGARRAEQKSPRVVQIEAFAHAAAERQRHC